MTRRTYVWVYDLAGDQVGVIGRDFLDIYTDVTLDQAERLIFELPIDHNKAYLIEPDIELRHRGRKYIVAVVAPRRAGSSLALRVEAVAAWYRLGENDYDGRCIVDAQGPAKGGDTILDGSGWTVDHARSVTEGTFSMDAEGSLLALCRRWAKITGTFVEFDTLANTVAWVATRGVNRGVAFRVGRNLIGVRRRQTAPAVTQLVPLGRDDLTVAGVNGGLDYVEDFSYYTARGLTTEQARARFTKRRVWRDTAFVAELDLLAAAEARLVTVSQAGDEVELDVVDISEITALSEIVDPADTVTAQDPALAGEWTATVTRVERHDLQPWRNRIELSTSPQLITDADVVIGGAGQSTWEQFLGPVTGSYEIRNDAVWTVARIPLRFATAGPYHAALDLQVTGVGAGDCLVEVYDATDAVVIRSTSVAYTDGATSRLRMTWGVDDVVGVHDLRLRVTTTASGGASSTKGVNLVIEETDASWWVMARGAVRETPTADNSEVFEYTGTVQSFTVPDNVTELTIECKAAPGGAPVGVGTGGAGGQVTATLVVTPGAQLDIYVGGMGAGHPSGVGGWPNGGNAGPILAGTSGGGGGGASYVTPTGAGIASALIVAPGGGGTCESDGGIGGFFQGGTAATVDGLSLGGGGATQSAGGTPGGGDTGGQGNGGTGGSGGTLDNSGGGGGGGWHGGGGGGTTGASGGAGGGGGSGYAVGSALELLIEDGSNTGAHGRVVVSWATPDA